MIWIGLAGAVIIVVAAFYITAPETKFKRELRKVDDELEQILLEAWREDYADKDR